jgi:hypothetical protein
MGHFWGPSIHFCGHCQPLAAGVLFGHHHVAVVATSASFYQLLGPGVLGQRLVLKLEVCLIAGQDDLHILN